MYSFPSNFPHISLPNWCKFRIFARPFLLPVDRSPYPVIAIVSRLFQPGDQFQAWSLRHSVWAIEIRNKISATNSPSKITPCLGFSYNITRHINSFLETIPHFNQVSTQGIGKALIPLSHNHVNKLLYILYIICYMLQIIYYILYNICYTLYIICYTIYTIYYMLYIIYYILYVIHYTLYIIYYMLYIIYHILYIICYILFIIYYILYITYLYSYIDTCVHSVTVMNIPHKLY
jgi:hypothetical protein